MIKGVQLVPLIIRKGINLIQEDRVFMALSPIKGPNLNSINFNMIF